MVNMCLVVRYPVLLLQRAKANFKAEKYPAAKTAYRRVSQRYVALEM